MRFSFMIFKLVLMRGDKNRKFPKQIVLNYECLMYINVVSFVKNRSLMNGLR